MQIYLITLLLLLFGCSAENANNYEPVVTGQRYFLTEWPDSIYVHSLDSIVKAEPIKKNSDSSNKTEISLKSFQMPKMVSTPTKKQPLKEKPKTESSTTATSSQETFPNRFMQALEKWQSDPSNTSLYVTVTALENEDAFQLMSRFYKTNTKILPKFYTFSALQSVNPGVSIEKIKAGDSIRLPRLK